MERKIPVWFLLLVVFFSLIFTVFFGSAVEHVLSGGQRYGSLGNIFVKVAMYPGSVKRAYKAMFGSSPLIIANRFPEIDGFLMDGKIQEGALNDEGYLLLSAFDAEKEQSTIKLMQINTQKVIYEWIPDVAAIRSSHKTDNRLINTPNMTPLRYRPMHPLLSNDGSIIFKDDGPLVKIDSCSRIEWTIDDIFHHSIMKDAEGNIWVPSAIEPPSFASDTYPRFRDDAITQISPDGKIIFNKSVSRILAENGYKGLLFGVGPYDTDAIHLNDIEPALSSTEYWQKGDLLISIRHRSTVFLYRPSTDTILWLQTGPWLNQHDADFIDDSRISIFGNDIITYPGAGLETNRSAQMTLINGHNDAYIYDFTDDTITTPLTQKFKELQVMTLTEGLQDFLENGDVFVEEQNYGRLLRFNPDETVWQFTNKISNEKLGMINWSRYLTENDVKNILPVLKQSSCN